MKCPLCDRPLGSILSEHHLIPITEGGRRGEVIHIHRICHDKIHATFHENELRDHYNTVIALRSHPAIAKFVKWVSEKPADFYASTRMTRTRWR